MQVPRGLGLVTKDESVVMPCGIAMAVVEMVWEERRVKRGVKRECGEVDREFVCCPN
jgi:hypothetical protein